jgi:hypothetical protein
VLRELGGEVGNDSFAIFRSFITTLEGFYDFSANEPVGNYHTAIHGADNAVAGDIKDRCNTVEKRGSQITTILVCI